MIYIKFYCIFLSLLGSLACICCSLNIFSCTNFRVTYYLNPSITALSLPTVNINIVCTPIIGLNLSLICSATIDGNVATVNEINKKKIISIKY